MFWRWFSVDGRVQSLETKVAELRSEIDARDRTIKVIEAERDAMAEVIARDRMRVQSETAAYARTVAENEK